MKEPVGIVATTSQAQFEPQTSASLIEGICYVNG